jgi:hypothetical protein
MQPHKLRRSLPAFVNHVRPACLHPSLFLPYVRLGSLVPGCKMMA